MPRPKSLNIGDIIAKGNLEIIGQKTVIEGRSKTKRGYSKVKCNLCGNSNKWMRNNLLKRSRTISCGCSTHDSSKWKSIGPKNMSWQLPAGEAAFNNLYYQYKLSAEKRGHCFLLSEKQFRNLTKQKCFYCGIEPSRIIKGQGKTSGDYRYNGIDRINNNDGYKIKNAVPCCFNCNSAKGTLSQKEFFELINRIYTLHLEINNETV
jgi:hypothetical protein